MLLPKFDFLRPGSIAETCDMLDEYGEEAQLLAGGTDLLVSLKRKLSAPALVVGIDSISELDYIESNRKEITIGPLVTAARIAEDSKINRAVPILKQASGGLGSPPIRNLATIGGNIVTARPAADLIPPLLVLDATLELRSVSGVREIALQKFLVGPGETRLASNELVQRIKVPRPGAVTGGAYIKFGARHSCEISIVSVAAFVELTPAGRRIKEARLALGAVAPTAIRCPKAESMLVGATTSESSFEDAAKAAAKAAKPISDHRGSARYRRSMVDVLTRRALTAACKAARASVGGRKR